MPYHPPLLSIETATPVCSAAIRLPNGEIIEKRSGGIGIHSEKLFLFVQQLLQNASLKVDNLGGVFFSAGPGSFTGLRIATSAVKGLLFQTDIPVYACSTPALFAVAVKFYLEKGVLPECFPFFSPSLDSFKTKFKKEKITGFETVIDARRQHLYHQSWAWKDGEISPETEIGFCTLEEAASRWTSDRIFAGTGLERIKPPPENEKKEEGKKGDYFYYPVSQVVGASHILDFFTKTKPDQHEKVIKKVAINNFEPYYSVS